MVGRLIQKQDIGTGDHHFGKKAAYFLTTRKNTDTFYTVFSWEKHTSKEASYIGSVLDLRILGQPVRDGQIIVKLLGIILREVCLGSGNTPFIITGIRLHLSGKDLEEGGDGKLIGTYKSHFVIAPKSKGDVVKDLYTVNGLGKIFYHQYLITDLTIWTEVNIWILTAGRTHIIQLDFFKSTFSGSSLFGFGSISAETGNKFLQLFDLFFFFLVCFFHLLDQQLAGLKPEIIVTCIKLDFAIINVSSLGTHFI